MGERRRVRSGEVEERKLASSQTNWRTRKRAPSTCWALPARVLSVIDCLITTENKTSNRSTVGQWAGMYTQRLHPRRWGLAQRGAPRSRGSPRRRGQRRRRVFRKCRRRHTKYRASFPRAGCGKSACPVRRAVAAMLVGVLAGESPDRGACPVTSVVISGGGAGDQSVESPDVKAPVGWVKTWSAPTRGASKSTGRSESEP